MSEDFSIAFVCLGNICRSPMAEQVFLAKLAAAPIAMHVTVSSGGTSGWHVGDAMDIRSAAVLRDNGYGTAHSGSKFDAKDFDGVDLVLAMDADNFDVLLRIAPSEEDRDKVRLFRSFDPDAPDGAEVPDPYYGGAQGFDHVLAMVEAAADGLLAHLAEQAPQP